MDVIPQAAYLGNVLLPSAWPPETEEEGAAATFDSSPGVAGAGWGWGDGAQHIVLCSSNSQVN